jgi:hypothetical protein
MAVKQMGLAQSAGKCILAAPWRPKGAEDRFTLVGWPARSAASDSGMLDT